MGNVETKLRQVIDNLLPLLGRIQARHDAVVNPDRAFVGNSVAGAPAVDACDIDSRT